MNDNVVSKREHTIKTLSCEFHWKQGNTNQQRNYYFDYEVDEKKNKGEINRIESCILNKNDKSSVKLG